MIPRNDPHVKARGRKTDPTSGGCAATPRRSEVISRIAEGHPIEDIISGIYNATSDRLTSLLQRVGIKEEVTMSGGVAKNMGVVEALQELLGTQLNIPFEPQTVRAVGAALIALEKIAR